MFVGKYSWANGNRYEGDYKDGTMNGTGNKSPSTPYHSTSPPPPQPQPQPQSNKMFIIIIIIITVWGGGFLSLFCIRKENIY